MIHCCGDLRWILIRVCMGAKPNKIEREIRRQRAAF